MFDHALTQERIGTFSVAWNLKLHKLEPESFYIVNAAIILWLYAWVIWFEFPLEANAASWYVTLHNKQAVNLQNVALVVLIVSKKHNVSYKTTPNLS